MGSAKEGVKQFLTRFHGRLIFIHLPALEVLPFCHSQRQRCIKSRVLGAQDFLCTAGSENGKRTAPPSTGGV